MPTILTEQDLKKHPSTESLPLLDEDDWRVQPCLCKEGVFEYAEAADFIRLFQLLHRDEYEPVAAVRHRIGGRQTIRIFFRKLHETILPLNGECESGFVERPERPLPR